MELTRGHTNTTTAPVRRNYQADAMRSNRSGWPILRHAGLFRASGNKKGVPDENPARQRGKP
jgi:hypothetical protein